MDSCSCQYSFEGPNNQKTIYYNAATHQKPYWILLTTASEAIKLEAGVMYLKIAELLSHCLFCNILAAA